MFDELDRIAIDQKSVKENLILADVDIFKTCNKLRHRKKIGAH
ncbi:MAG: hypothetical protein AAB309_03725 [Deltaproteobacteria bacterium]